MELARRSKDRLFFILYNLVVILILVGCSELLLRYLIHNPKSIPSGLLGVFRNHYSQYLRNTIQMDTSCARYDRGLFYTLKPGKCKFANAEFDTDLTINSAGLRDNEAALDAPSIIFLGDSFTMGWGVDQDSTFAKRIEKSLGVKTLNAGISSFGTARELQLLSQLDLSRLRALVIQYHGSDLEENKSYVDNGKLQISSREIYDQAIRNVNARTKYYFGKHTAMITKGLLKELTIEDRPARRPTSGEDVTFFLHVLETSPVPLDSIQLYVFAVSSFGDTDIQFTKILQNEISKDRRPEFIRNMHIIDVQSGLSTDEDYFLLDDHINARGHSKLASKLLESLDTLKYP